ncbi:head GIN domain-containing protein [Chitinimonas sp. JJ19]|uniref:head GIN domain-containing protein n=1 Tax=Chitinimonas sp. JJ19 TaxID=3109352 RepID=UPI0030006CD4
MKNGLWLMLCLPMMACTVHVNGDEATEGGGKWHVSVGGWGGVKGNGKLVTETRPLAAVQGVELRGPIEVNVRVVAGSAASMTLEGDENLLKFIVTEQVGDALVIRTNGNFSSTRPLKVNLVLPALARINSSGSGDIVVQGLDAQRFELEASGPGDTRLEGKVAELDGNVSGSGDLVLDRLEAGRVVLDQSGPGDVTLRGRASSLQATVSGSGDLMLAGLEGPAELRLDGPGSASVRGKVAGLLVQSSGSGSVAVDGISGGTVKVDGSGPGDIRLVGQASNIKIALTGSGDLNAGALSMQDVELEMHGPGDVMLGTVAAERFHAQMSGSGDLQAVGSVRDLLLQVDGPGEAGLSRLVAQNAKLQSTGSGDISADVRNRLEAQSDGPGEIRVQGKPAERNVQGKRVQVQS